jgi:DprA winged helix domain
MSLLKDAEKVYTSLLQQSPQDIRELAQATGLDSDRVQMAVVWLELRGRADWHLDGNEDSTRSSSWVSVRKPAWHPEGREAGIPR